MADGASDVLRVEGISKTFPGTRALDAVSVSFARGEIHALLGNNGSGKSTLIKILAGVYAADKGGVIHVAGRSFAADDFSPDLARSHGLHFVHQNPALFPLLSVAENLALGRGFETRRLGRIDWTKQRARAEALIARFHIQASPDQPAYRLDPPDRTLVAIARALQDQEDVGEGVLFLDEPTAALAAPEVERLMSALRRYAQAGQTIIFVSHRLDEVLANTDRVSALRDGKHVGTSDTREMSESKLVALMLGHNVESQARQRAPGAPATPARLTISKLRGRRVHGLDLSVSRGEVVGLAGLLGSGASEVLRLLFGAEPWLGGESELDGRRYAPRGPSDAIAQGVAYVPPDRALESSFAALSVRANLSAANVGRYFRGLRLRHDRERDDARAALSRFAVRVATDRQAISTLSGGNQQKVIVARWLRDEPRLLLLDEPTQGVAAHARSEIHGFLRAAAERGMALLVVSSDFEELCALCDRVMVLARGRKVAEVSADQLDAHRLTELAHFAPEATS